MTIRIMFWDKTLKVSSETHVWAFTLWTSPVACCLFSGNVYWSYLKSKNLHLWPETIRVIFLDKTLKESYKIRVWAFTLWSAPLACRLFLEMLIGHTSKVKICTCDQRPWESCFLTRLWKNNLKYVFGLLLFGHPLLLITFMEMLIGHTSKVKICNCDQRL